MTKPLFAGGKNAEIFKKDCAEKNWDREDLSFARLAGAICNMNQEAVMHASGLTQEGWDKMVEKGFIEKVIDGRTTLHHTTEYGRQVFELMNGSRCYVSSAESYRHDKELCNVFSELSDAERASWKSEAQLKFEIGNKADFDMKGCSVTDGCYISDETGEYVMIEILTKWYKTEIREAKVEFVKQFKLNYGSGIYAPTDIDANKG